MSERPDQPRDPRPAILLLAGFGDDASMFDALAGTRLADSYRLHPVNLPGFGAPPLTGDTTLDALAQTVADEAARTRAEIVVAHSVASIIASLAAYRPGCPVTTILSLEGNITAEDAYFSGTAADYDDPSAFRTAFLARLDEMAKTAPVLGRYRDAVSKADRRALWQLGTDARRFSQACVPGEVLQGAARVTYLYNPDNCPDSTIRWLEDSGMARIVLEHASHWASVDRPDMLAEKIAEALRPSGTRSVTGEGG